MQLSFLLLSIFFTFIFILIFSKLAHIFKLIDYPNSRKIHSSNVPVIGGVAINLNLILAIIIFPTFFPNNIKYVIYVCSFLTILGAVDDVYYLNYIIKIISQLIIITFIYFLGVKIHTLGNFSTDHFIYLGLFTFPFTVFMIFGFINSVNFIDGIDGLSSSYISLILVIFSLFSYLYSGYIIEQYIIFFFVSLIVFIFFNFSIFNSPKVFMGDSGTFFISSLIASILIIYSQNPLDVIHPLLIPWCMNVIIYDLLFNSIRRVYNKSNPFEPDSDHIHHKLLALGFSHFKIILIILLAQIVLSFIGYLIFSYISIFLSITAFVIMFFIYSYLLVNLNKYFKI